ncbi:MAG: GNAT family N-acyltransferase [Alphaproteobacteria bacterium]
MSDQLRKGIRSGHLLVRLAATEAEIEASQTLRYRVFYEEMAAQPSEAMRQHGRDFDTFDSICDHLLVVDADRGDGPEGVVGSYRLLRRETALAHGGFYSADEYDITPLQRYPEQILELGRSCVDAEYRSGPAMQLLWQGIAAYIIHHDVAVMFGCASLPGTRPEENAEVLSYLYHYHLAPPAVRPRALASRRVDMNFMPAEEVDQRRARANLPPLIKGYMRLGGCVGDGAVVDHQFNTTDVCIVVNTELVTDRYFRHYQRNVAERAGTGATLVAGSRNETTRR